MSKATTSALMADREAMRQRIALLEQALAQALNRMETCIRWAENGRTTLPKMTAAIKLARTALPSIPPSDRTTP